MTPEALPLAVLGKFLRLIYGYRVERAERFPAKGPLVVLYPESSAFASVMDSVHALSVIARLRLVGSFRAFAAPEFRLFGMSFLFRYRRAATFSLPKRGISSSSFSLLDGLRLLRAGGVIFLNPEGDLSLDGRPSPVQNGAAWLALHSGSPLVLVVSSPGAYDIWPPWRIRPSLRGRAILRIGEPFVLSEHPLIKVGPADLRAANQRIEAEIEKLWFEPLGPRGWAAGPVKNAKPVDPLGSIVRVGRAPAGAFRPTSVPSWRQGIPQLLWQCPVCRTNDALRHTRQVRGRSDLRCPACGTRWEVRRVPGRDFRLKVVEGPAENTGLEMALSDWNDAMRAGFVHAPAGEPGLFSPSGVKLLVDSTNPVVGTWGARTPPDDFDPGRSVPWTSLGSGSLCLAEGRLIWLGSAREIEIPIAGIRSLTPRFFRVLIVQYGLTYYRFLFHHESALKWIAYIDRPQSAPPSASN